MADATTIDELRRLINEPGAEVYTDEELSRRIDADDSAPEGDLGPLASKIWREKAASLSGLIDVREGSSDRKLSQLYKQALDMAAGLSTPGSSSGGSARRSSRTRAIERQ